MAHTSMATIVNFSGSVSLQVLSIIRKNTITIYTPRRHQSLEPGQKIVVENLRTQEWKPVVIQGKTRGIPRSCVVSIPSDRELRHNQSQIRLSPIGPDHRDRWVKVSLTEQTDRQRSWEQTRVSVQVQAAQPVNLSFQDKVPEVIMWRSADKLSKHHWFDL